MATSTKKITDHFKGQFISKPEVILEKLLKCRLFVFDWDGVFNNGQKDEYGASPFSEVDSMGTNMLRFNHYLHTGKVPFTAIISGEKNNHAIAFAQREHFHSIYGGIKYKPDAFLHLCTAYHVAPEEVAFFFDDVIDFGIAELCGLKMMVNRSCNPLLIDLAIRKGLVDYVTANEGGHGAIREATELLMGIRGKYDETHLERVGFTQQYQEYLAARNEPITLVYESRLSKIVERSSL